MLIPRPQISVIIPTYNRAYLIPRAIRSILNQTYSNFEVIIVDDASKDNTEIAVKEFQDHRIRYIRHSKNLGGSAARNTGIHEANGEYIAFLDDDDEYLPNKFSVMSQPLAESSGKVGLAYSRVRLVDYFYDVLFPYNGKNGNLFIDMLATPQFHISSTLIKKTHIVLFNESLARYQDVDFHLRILEKHEVLFINAITALWHWGHEQERITTNIKAFEEAIKYIENEFFIKKGYFKQKAVYGRFLRFAGNILILDNNAKSLGKKYISRSIRIHPSMFALFDYLSSYFGYSLHQKMFKMKNRILKLFSNSK